LSIGLEVCVTFVDGPVPATVMFPRVSTVKMSPEV
jgi:hypothetical protein